METLRWILLAFGLLVLLGVYLHSKGLFSLFRNISLPKKRDVSAPVERAEPSIDGASPPAEPAVVGGAEAAATDSSSESATDPRVRNPRKIVAIRLVPEDEGAQFGGEELVMAMRNQDLRHGKHGVFHRLEEGETGEGRFCVASLVEPGSFDLENLRGVTYPGVSLFMLLPLPIDHPADGVLVFDDMMTVARALAEELDGHLLDESGNSLSIQRERYLREEVIEFERVSRAAPEFS